MNVEEKPCQNEFSVGYRVLWEFLPKIAKTSRYSSMKLDNVGNGIELNLINWLNVNVLGLYHFLVTNSIYFLLYFYSPCILTLFGITYNVHTQKFTRYVKVAIHILEMSYFALLICTNSNHFLSKISLVLTLDSS